MFEINRAGLFIGLAITVISTAVISVIWTVTIRTVRERRKRLLRDVVRTSPEMCAILTEAALSCDLLCMMHAVLVSSGVTGCHLWKLTLKRDFALRKLARRLDLFGLDLGFVSMEADAASVMEYLRDNLGSEGDAIQVPCGTVSWDRPVIVAPYETALQRKKDQVSTDD